MKKKNEIRKVRKVKHEYINWDEDAERLVLYADVMGFKSRVMTKSHEQLKQEFLDDSYILDNHFVMQRSFMIS